MRRPLSLFVAMLSTALCAHARAPQVKTPKVAATPISISFGTQSVGKTTRPLDFTAGVYPQSVATADFNGDGKLDIAVANSEGKNISVLFGNGDGTLQPPVNYSDDPGPQFVVAADLNGDGKPDLAAADYTSGVSIFLNNGDGTFPPEPTDYSTGYGSAALAVGDVNGDGIPDVVAANYTGDTVSVLLGEGDGTFLPSTSYKVGASAYSVALGDFNDDGKMDIAVSLQYSTQGKVGVLLGNGDGTFQKVITSPTGAGPTGLVDHDFNGDGELDVAVGSEGTGRVEGSTVCVLLGKGDGTFQPPVQYTVGTYPAQTVMADFNGDGKEDLAVISSASANFSILLGKGNGSFQPAVSYVTGLLSYAIAAGDFTGSGVLDVVTASAYFTSDVFLGNGNGTFQDYDLLLTNTGSLGTDLKYSFAGPDAKDFALSGSCPYLGAGGNCILETSFTPKASGLRTATLQVTDPAGQLLTSVTLSGTGR
jgi:hypothetical protein